MELIAPTVSAVQVTLLHDTKYVNKTIRVLGSLDSGKEIVIERPDASGGWVTYTTLDDGEIKLTSSNPVLGVYAALGMVRFNKPVTINPVGLEIG